MKKIFDWLRNSIIGHLVLMVLLVLALALIAYYAMDWGTSHSARRTVPEFVGLAMDDASLTAEELDLEVVANDSVFVAAYPGGVIMDQLPAAGSIVKPGRKIYVTISSMTQRKAVVPYVAKRTLRQAINSLELAGFTIEKLKFVNDMATNYVLREYHGKKEILKGSKYEAPVGSGVVLQVGVASGEEPIAVPQLSGLTLLEAKNRLWEVGLNVNDVKFDQGIPALERSNAKVYYQSINPGKRVRHGEGVSLRLSIDKSKVSNSVKEGVKSAEEEEKRAKQEADSLAKVAEQRRLDSLAALEPLLMSVAEVAVAEATSAGEKPAVEQPKEKNATVSAQQEEPEFF